VNSKIYDEKVIFPDDKREHMRVCALKVKDADKTTEGYKRNQELQGKKTITYKQLKRIKNFFDNYKGKQTTPEFILNGGIEMKTWVNNELRYGTKALVFFKQLLARVSITIPKFVKLLLMLLAYCNLTPVAPVFDCL
jgi:hypothetical protein